MLLLLSAIALITGYYLMAVSADASYNEVTKRMLAGISLISAGGISLIIYVLRRR